MANQEHLNILKQGVDVWNQWREDHSNLRPDLSSADFLKADLSGVNLSRANLFEADLGGADLGSADLSGADLRDINLFEAKLFEATLSRANLSRADLLDATLSRANLSIANLSAANLGGAKLDNADLRNAKLGNAKLLFADLAGADLRGADLRGADFTGAVLRGANLKGADLRDAKLLYADLHNANLRGANLSRADLSGARLVATIFTNATLQDCNIYGISAWNVQLKGARQNNLVITSGEEPTITVDNLEVAQFIYLLLNNPKIREVIDTIAKKAVLILGRFTPERKAVLDALKEALRTHGYLPILFDFDKPTSRDITETVSTLAHLSRFIIADITDAKSIPQELMLIVPNLPSVPVQPLILESQHEYGMFEHFKKFPWVLPTHHYQNTENLLASLQAKVIEPAEQKAQEIAKR